MEPWRHRTAEFLDHICGNLLQTDHSFEEKNSRRITLNRVSDYRVLVSLVNFREAEPPGVWAFPKKKMPREVQIDGKRGDVDLGKWVYKRSRDPMSW